MPSPGRRPAIPAQVLRRGLVALCLLWVCGLAMAQQGYREIREGLLYWLDGAGQASASEVAALPPGAWQMLPAGARFDLMDGALWLRLERHSPAGMRHYLLVDFGALDDAQLHARDAQGRWTVQRAGDRVPMSQWPRVDRQPVFLLSDDPSTTQWLRLANRPVPLSVRLIVLDEAGWLAERATGNLLLGIYLGLGLLVLVVGLTNARLHHDRAFLAYAAYVAGMLGLQVAYTGLGGQFLWGEHPDWNNAAPSVFTLLTSSTSIWFLREVCAVRRLSRSIDRALRVWSLLGLLLIWPYVARLDGVMLRVLHVYVTVGLVVAVLCCVWAWWRGEKPAGWVLLGFLPVLAALPFPLLRNVGLLSASFLTQYGLIVGASLEIPVLLVVLNRRARDFSENRARMRSLDSTDPLTGLLGMQVLEFRMRDSLRRARLYRTRCALLLVELANHDEIAQEHGREVADRALVVTASRLSRIARDVDTVSRSGPARFAMLVEAPVPGAMVVDLATRIVAHGLATHGLLPGGTSLKLHVVSLLCPHEASEASDESPQACLRVLGSAMDELRAEGRRGIHHLNA